MNEPKIYLPKLAWHETPMQSSRHGEAVRLIVAHRWASPVAKTPAKARSTYEGVVSYLCRTPRPPDTGSSAHLVYGGSLVDEATQLVRWDGKAWHAASFNSCSEGIEYADAIWSGDGAAGDDPEGFKVAARIHAFRLHVRGLPAKWVHGDALVHGGRGMTRHLDLGALGGGHTDPTTDVALWELFVERTAFELKRVGFRKTWGRT